MVAALDDQRMRVMRVSPAGIVEARSIDDPALRRVSPEEASAIEAYLEKEYGEGRLIYGIHRADAALMTCLVFDLEQGEHVHFIDGSGGGFALAATGFKKRFADLVQRTAAAPQ